MVHVNAENLIGGRVVASKHNILALAVPVWHNKPRDARTIGADVDRDAGRAGQCEHLRRCPVLGGAKGPVDQTPAARHRISGCPQ